MNRLLGLMLACVVSLATVGSLEAQAHEADPVGSPGGWENEVGYGAINALIAGVGAGVIRKARGGSFLGAFAGGSLGGGLQYLGRRAASAHYDGAGALGRGVHALGASASRSAARGAPAFDQILIPAGPMWLEWDRTRGDVQARIDAQGTFWLAYGVFQSHLDLDWGRSLSAGTFVFTSSGPLTSLDPAIGSVLGREAGGVVLLRGDLAPEVMAEAYAHEQVHVLQRDASYALFSEPADRFLFEYTGSLGARIMPYVHLGVSDLLWDPIFRDLREAEASTLGARE